MSGKNVTQTKKKYAFAGLQDNRSEIWALRTSFAVARCVCWSNFYVTMGELHGDTRGSLNQSNDKHNLPLGIETGNPVQGQGDLAGGGGCPSQIAPHGYCHTSWGVCNTPRGTI